MRAQIKAVLVSDPRRLVGQGLDVEKVPGR